MKVNFFITKTPQFKGVREDRNTVSQLKENNDYSLNEPNQRRINQAIENLAKQRGEENIRFLLDVADNLKYQGHVPNKNVPSKNEWGQKLKSAAEESLTHSNPILREKYQPQIDKVFAPKQLTPDEEAIDTYKTRILKRVKGYEKEKEISKNLDYFITSSETPIEQKKYVMKRLDYFMSPKYKINEQLRDKKPQVLSEIVNDITINTPESKVPNIKAINQKTHGMCAAIAIARKAIAYEDKPNYVDAILSELDNTDKVMIYDRQNLGSGKRVPVKKIYVDFDYAQQRGYRIVDASTLQWMNIGGMYGVQNESLHCYNAFDKNNLDAFHDSYFTKNFADESLMQKQAYFQALTKAKSDIGSVKSSQIKKDVNDRKMRNERHLNIDKLSKYNADLRKTINEIAPTANKQSRVIMMDELMKLPQHVSSEIEKLPVEIQKYAFIPNEENTQKKKKVEAYFSENVGKTLVNKDVLAKKSESIVDTLEDIRTISQEINANTSASAKIANARKLYEAEAIFRASIVLGLMERDNRDDMLIKYDIPDRETRILDGFDKVIDRIEKKDDKKLLEHFAPYFSAKPDDKKAVLEGLREFRGSLNYLMTDGLDEIYKSMGFGNRKDVLLNDMSDCIDTIKNGDKQELHRAATCLHMKEDKNKVLKTLSGLAEKLEKNPNDQKAYEDAFNKMGYKGQVDAFVDLFKMFTNNMSKEDSFEKEMLMAKFKEVNGLKEDATPEELLGALSEIGNNFNILATSMEGAASMLDVPNEDGTPYFTINAQAIVTKKLEKEGKLIPIPTMIKLQDRFAKIDKIRSSDEFASRQGKISDPTLYKLSHEEKQGIKQIEKNINSMYAHVTRELEHQYREIREPLEEMARYVGTNEGNYWVIKDGDSGMFGDQQVKIFEQLTDRPHYEEENIDKAVELIKNGTHSGVSSSSVFHDRQGGHAQYVVDVVKDEHTGKDILFHDNTWGASEHENTWTDSNGLTRTDYSDRRGGELGYITNDEWRNGNFVENLTHKKGHISPENVESRQYKKINPHAKDSYDFSLMSGIILEGDNPTYKDVAGTIKDEIFIPDTVQIPKLEKMANEMTKDEIKKAILRNKTIGADYKKHYAEIMERITPTTFNKGITTEAQYNALPNDDIVKVAFEKTAVRNRFEDASMYKELAKVKTVDEVNEIKKQQRQIAYKDFQYSFYKGGIKDNIVVNAGLKHGTEFSMALINTLKEHNISIELDKLTDILRGAAQFQKDEQQLYNGSLKNSLDIIKERISKQYDENVPQSEESKIAKAEFMQKLSDVYDKHVYFTEEDLKANTPKTKAIRQWIDDTFNPQSDKEFVQIYRNLQDMTSEEFNKLTKNIDDKYLGIGQETGYEILEKCINSNPHAKQDLKNVLFYDEYSRDLNMSKTKPYYRNKKLERNVRSMSYVGQRTFDDLYRTMYFGLNQLEYPKMFNEYKDANYRKYGAFPAYPKLDLSEDEVLNEKLTTTARVVQQTYGTLDTQKNCIYDIKLAHMLDDYRKSIPSDRPVNSIEDKVIKTLVGDFITANSTDEDMDEALNAAYNLMEIKGKSNIETYNKHIDTIVNTIGMIENVNSVKDFEESNLATGEALKDYFKVIMNTNVPPKYHRQLKDEAKTWLKLEKQSRNQTNGLDRNRELLELQGKIMSNSTSTDKKAQIEGFMEIMDALNKTKVSNIDTKKTPETIDAQLAELHKISDKYLDKYAKPESKNNLKGNLNDWYRKELVGGAITRVREEDVDRARELFLSDFKKHHLTSHPSEVLDNFLLLSAKDAEPTRQQKTYKKYLETEVNLAKFVAIQDSLMEAVQAGNAAQVKNYFDEYMVDPYNNENVVSMNSDAAIDYMVRSLIIDSNPQTARMFVEKLGLGERVIKLELNTIKQVNPKEKINNVAKELRNSKKLTDIVTDEYTKLLKTADTTENIELEINRTKRNISKRTKTLEDKKSVKTLLAALDSSKEGIKERPTVSKSVVISNNLNDALEEINENINGRIKEEQEYINVVNALYKFLQDIQFPENSRGIKMQEKVAKEQQALAEYNNKVLAEVTADNPNVVIGKRHA